MQLLTFRVSDSTLGLELARVLEVIKLGKLKKLPWEGGEVLGIGIFRDRSTPVVNLASRLGAVGEEEGERRYGILTEANGVQVAFAISSIAKVLWVDTLRIDTPPADKKRFFWGVVRDGESVIWLLEPEHVFTPKEASEVTNQFRPAEELAWIEERLKKSAHSLKLKQLKEARKLVAQAREELTNRGD